MNFKTDTLKTWRSINLDAIAHNYNYTKSGTNAKIICVIKADAYGHGALPVAKRLLKEGCDYFAVSSIEEAIELRQGGINCNILVLGYILPCLIQTAIENDISFACASYEFAKLISNVKTSKKARVHIKLNTGMNRTGFCICHKSGYDDLDMAIEIIKSADNIKVEGVFSHFASAEDNRAFSEKQWGYFSNAVDYIKKAGINPDMLHICNSAGTVNFPEKHLDAIRLGIHLYGCESDDENYIQAMDFCTRIVDIHTLKEGDGVSYGLDFIADRKMTIAVIGAGYGDGVLRCLSDGKGYVVVRGKKCPIIGRVCMDMTMIDITDVPDAKVEDIVTIWGNGLPTEEQAKNAGTISYELMCSVSPRVAKVYE